MRMRRTFTGVAVAAALMLVLAGCGGDDDDSGGSVHTTEPAATTEADEADETTTTVAGEETSTTEAEGTTTTEAGPSDEEAQALVDGIDLTAEDLTEFGGSWSVEDDDEDEDDEGGLEECFGETGDIEPVAESESEIFSSQSEIRAVAGSGTLLFETVEDATATMDAASTEEFRACAEEFALDGADSGRIDSYPEATRYGDQWVVLGGVAEATADDGTPISVGIDIHLLRTGPLVTLFLYYDVSGGDQAAPIVDGLVSLLDQRQTEAVG